MIYNLRNGKRIVKRFYGVTGGYRVKDFTLCFEDLSDMDRILDEPDGREKLKIMIMLLMHRFPPNGSTVDNQLEEVRKEENDKISSMGNYSSLHVTCRVQFHPVGNLTDA